MLEALGGPSVPAGLARVVFRETEGNPFFVEEVFQHLSEEGRFFDDEGRWRSDLRIDELRVPEGVRLVIGRRLERVSDDARRALATGAVIGRHFHLTLVEAAGGVKGDDLLDALEAAERAQRVSSATSGRDVRYTFAHELIRQTLVENLSLPRRQRLHLRIATALEELHGASPEKVASSLAHHFYQAGAAADDQKALRYLTLAGEQAHALSPWVLDAMKGGMVVGLGMIGVTEMVAGIAAACGAEWETAERHHQTALRQAEDDSAHDHAARGPPVVRADADRPQRFRRQGESAHPARRGGRDVWAARHAPASGNRPGDERHPVEVRSQKSEVRSQEAEARRQKPGGVRAPEAQTLTPVC